MGVPYVGEGLLGYARGWEVCGSGIKEDAWD